MRIGLLFRFSKRFVMVAQREILLPVAFICIAEVVVAVGLLGEQAQVRLHDDDRVGQPVFEDQVIAEDVN